LERLAVGENDSKEKKRAKYEKFKKDCELGLYLIKNINTLKEQFSFFNKTTSTMSTVVQVPDQEHFKENQNIGGKPMVVGVKSSLSESLQLPNGWAAEVDPISGCVYYVDHINKQTQREHPNAVLTTDLQKN
jgi:hypothetical protein